MSHEEHRQRQQAILDKALDILTHDARVLGIVAVGSYARGEHDAFSDLDLACYLADEERSGRAELYERVGGVAPLLCRLWLSDLHALYLFANGVRLDLDFCRPGELGKDDRYLRGSTLILHDPQGALAASLVLRDQLPAAAHPKAHRSAPALSTGCRRRTRWRRCAPA